MHLLLNRHVEISSLRRTLDGLGPSLVVVRGPEGVGTTTLTKRAVEDRPHVRFAAAPLTDADNRAMLSERLRLGRGPLDWPALLDRLADRIEESRERMVLVLDGFEFLLAARTRLPTLLAAFWTRVRAHSLPLHLVIVGSDPRALGALSQDGSPLEEAITLDLELGPLPFRAVTDVLRSWPRRDRFLAWTIWGGMPSVVRHLDPSMGLVANLRRTILEPDAPLLHAGSDLLRRSVQSPARYGSILRAAALGRREWGELATAIPELTTSGQLGPYLARLEELRLLEARRPLDAREGSRSRRYHPPDPFLPFWLRFVLPHRVDLEAGAVSEVWTRRIRPELPAHAGLFFPDLARTWVDRYAERLPAPARESGALWGPDYEVDVAAILRSGGVCYGICHWGEDRANEAVLDTLEESLARSRYGYGREARLRVVFHANGAGDALVRRAARDELIRLVGLGDLLDGGIVGPPPREPSAPARERSGGAGGLLGTTGV